MTDYGGTDGERERARVKHAAAYEEAKRRQRDRSGQRLSDAQVAAKADKIGGLDYICDVNRCFWFDGLNGDRRCTLQANPCNGARGKEFECCFACSQWFLANRERLQQWFSLAVTVDYKIARYFVNRAQGLRAVFPLPFET